MRKITMKIDWNNITREHVLTAIDLFLRDEPYCPEAKSTFLMYNDKKLPAKHIRGMAYKVAFGKELSKHDYSGGMETVRFFKKLGFDMCYSGQIIRGDFSTDTKSVKIEKTEPVVDRPEKSKNPAQKITIPTKGVIEQKNALQLILNNLCEGDVVCEKTFPWMKTPETYTDYYKKIYEALHAYRGHNDFAKKNISLRCDFVCESKKLIIEYDERQHFTTAREISLACYKDLDFYYDADLWKKACNDVNAKDNVPVNRDETRAFYDSVRDIEAARHGYRLVRIMHGQIDFEQENAKKKLSEILKFDTTEKADLKIGLYLQTEDVQNPREFRKVISAVKKADIDLLVFPEISYTPFTDMINSSDITDKYVLDEIIDKCIQLSKDANCAVIIGSIDYYDTIFSLYANANCSDNETRHTLYIKHTATKFSCFDFDDFEAISETNFTPILLKGNRIAMTICYDCNHALFSRMYGIQGIDIIINLTGGNVVYDKWHKYTKTRAIENNCFTFTTMGGAPEENSYVYGFTPSGKELEPEIIYGNGDSLNIPGTVYLYNKIADDSTEQEDRRLNQEHTKNKYVDFVLDSNKLTELLNSSDKIEKNLYHYKYNDIDMIFILVNNEDVFYAENFLPLMYSEKLQKYKNKRYLIINQFDHLDKELYENKLSVVLKVRAMENYCAVLLKSDLITMCYQTSQNRTAQVLRAENGCFGLDLSRMKGPETIWKNKPIWRNGYSWLIKQCVYYKETGIWLKKDNI